MISSQTTRIIQRAAPSRWAEPLSIFEQIPDGIDNYETCFRSSLIQFWRRPSSHALYTSFGVIESRPNRWVYPGKLERESADEQAGLWRRDRRRCLRSPLRSPEGTVTVYNGSYRCRRPKMPERAHDRATPWRLRQYNASWLIDMSNRPIIYCKRRPLCNVAVEYWMAGFIYTFR